MDNQNTPTTIIIQDKRKSNGLGVAGFVLALIGLILFWVPVLNWILWVLGLVFSLIGIFRSPRGLAIAGLVISSFYLVLITIVISAIGLASI